MKILFIIPYPELKQLVDSTIQKIKLPDTVFVTSVVAMVDEAMKIDATGVDAIIARGYTSLMLREKYPYIINVELEITSYDIFRALTAIKNNYAPNKVGFCGTYSFMENSRELEGWLGCPLEVYNNPNFKQIKNTVVQACTEGCDVILGGYSAKKYAEELGIRGAVIETGSEAVNKALAEAIRSIRIKQEEQIKAEMYRLITKNAAEGILFVDLNGIIGVDNQAAQEMGRHGALCRQPLIKVLPQLTRYFQQTVSGQKDYIADILKLSQDLTVSATLVPVKSKGEIYGVVINLVDITRIQQLEGQIRSKLSEKGLQTRYSFENIVYKSRIMQATIATARLYSESDANIIIVGETGTGKEVFAQSIHHYSRRTQGPFVAINCAALPESLLESELFGYVDGAFTGSHRGGKMGLFEQAHGGTLFLDEISEIPIALQSKLLRALQEKEVRRLGADKVIRIDVRIIAATNKNLKEQAEQGKFRKDLLYRLDVLRIFLPPLRQREGDVELLFHNLLQELGAKNGVKDLQLAPEALRFLRQYPFEGNIRELRNIVERICALHQGGVITGTEMEQILYPRDVEENTDTLDERVLIEKMRQVGADETTPGSCFCTRKIVGTQSEVTPVNFLANAAGQEKGPAHLLSSRKDEAEKKLLLELSAQYHGHKGLMAAALGINRSTLWRKLKKFNLG